jgi:hypothetical protein
VYALHLPPAPTCQTHARTDARRRRRYHLSHPTGWLSFAPTQHSHPPRRSRKPDRAPRRHPAGRPPRRTHEVRSEDRTRSDPTTQARARPRRRRRKDRSVTTATRPTTRVCAEPGCSRLVTAATRCSNHATPGRGRPYRRASQHVLAATHCAVCGEAFSDQLPPTRGHIVALENGGSNDPSNFQAECEPCNLGRRS